jgi:hypothetical protein
MWASRLLDQLQSKQGKQAQQKTDFEKKIRFGKVLNAVFNLAMRLDEWCLKQRWSLPFGGTLMLVAHKPTSLR